MQKSQCLMFILSPAFLEYEWCEYMFQHAVAQKYRDMVFVIYKHIPKQLWTTQMEPMKSAVSVALHKVTWPDAQNKTSLPSLNVCKWIIPCAKYKDETDDSVTKVEKENPDEEGKRNETDKNAVCLKNKQGNKTNNDRTEILTQTSKTGESNSSPVKDDHKYYRSRSVKEKDIELFWKKLRYALRPRLSIQGTEEKSQMRNTSQRELLNKTEHMDNELHKLNEV